MDISEETAIREIKAGNQKVFGQVFKKYYPMLNYEARGYAKSKDLAEDIVCEVLTRIWHNREKLFIKTSLRDYLIKSVHNHSIDYYRQQKTQEKLKTEIEETNRNNYTLADLGENPLDYILTRELEEHIQKAVESLPAQYKKAFQLSRFEDLSYEEIAVEMRISVNSVKTNIKNALAKLREQLIEYMAIIILFVFKVFF